MSQAQGNKKNPLPSKNSPMAPRRNKKKAEQPPEGQKEEAEPTASKTPRTDADLREEDKEEDEDFETRKARKSWPHEVCWPSHLQAFMRVQSLGEPEKVSLFLKILLLSSCFVLTNECRAAQIVSGWILKNHNHSRSHTLKTVEPGPSYTLTVEPAPNGFEHDNDTMFIQGWHVKVGPARSPDAYPDYEPEVNMSRLEVEPSRSTEDYDYEPELFGMRLSDRTSRQMAPVVQQHLRNYLSIYDTSPPFSPKPDSMEVNMTRSQHDLNMTYTESGDESFWVDNNRSHSDLSSTYNDLNFSSDSLDVNTFESHSDLNMTQDELDSELFLVDINRSHSDLYSTNNDSKINLSFDSLENSTLGLHTNLNLSYNELEQNDEALVRVKRESSTFPINPGQQRKIPFPVNPKIKTRLTNSVKGKQVPEKGLPANSWPPSEQMEADLFPFVRLETQDDMIIVHTHRKYHETIFAQEDFEYNLEDFHILEEQLKGHLSKLDTFFNQDPRYLYIGHVRRHACISGCREHQMIVTHRTDNVDQVVGPNAKYWVLPIRHPDENAAQICAAHRQENYWETRLPFSYIALLNSSNPLSDCYLSFFRRVSSFIYQPACYHEGAVIKNPFQITKATTLDSCQLRCISKIQCGAFSLVHYTNGTKECLLGTSITDVSTQNLHNVTAVTYSHQCEHCEAGGGPAVLSQTHPLRLTGQCAGVYDLMLSAHCLCESEGWDSESTTSLAAVRGLFQELQTNSLQTDDQLSFKPRSTPAPRQKRYLRGIFGRAGSRAGSRASSMSSLKTSFSDLLRKLKIKRPGTSTNAVVPYSRLGGRTSGFKPGMRRFMQKFKKGAEFLTVPLILTLVGWELGTRIKSALNPEKETDLSDLLPMFLDKALNAKFPEPSVDAEGRNFTLSPFVGNFTPALPFSGIENIHDFQSARTLFRSVLKLAKIVATGSQLWDYLMKGGRISPKGTPMLTDLKNSHMLAWSENRTIRQLAIRPTNETQPLEYFAVAVIPAGQTDLTKELLFSTALDKRGIVYAHSSSHTDCVDQVTHERDLSDCYQNTGMVPQVSCVESSPSHNLIRLISRSSWHVLMRCPASQSFQYLDLAPITILFLHKSCVLTWRTGADLWQNPDIDLAWPTLRLANLYKIVHTKSFPKPIPVTWIMTASNTGVLVMSLFTLTGIMVWIKCKGKWWCASAGDVDFDSRVTIEKSQPVPESPVLQPQYTPRAAARGRLTRYEMAPMPTRERRPSGRSLPPIPSAPVSHSEIEYATEDRLPPSGTLKRQVKYVH